MEVNNIPRNGFFQAAVGIVAIISAVVAVVFWVTSEVSSINARLVIIEKQVEDINVFRYQGDRFTEVQGDNLRSWFQNQLSDTKIELKEEIKNLRLELLSIQRDLRNTK